MKAELLAALELVWAALLIGLGTAGLIVSAYSPLPDKGTWDRASFAIGLILAGALIALGLFRLIRAAVVQGIRKEQDS